MSGVKVYFQSNDKTLLAEYYKGFKGQEWRKMSDNTVTRISCEEVKRMMDAGEKVVLIDTRIKDEFTIGHIHGAVNIYYNVLGDPQERELTLSVLPGDTLLIPYCA
jgi:3-mercaptopyruvate sulfurtransferase SseA